MNNLFNSKVVRKREKGCSKKTSVFERVQLLKGADEIYVDGPDMPPLQPINEAATEAAIETAIETATETATHGRSADNNNLSADKPNDAPQAVNTSTTKAKNDDFSDEAIDDARTHNDGVIYDSKGQRRLIVITSQGSYKCTLPSRGNETSPIILNTTR